MAEAVEAVSSQIDKGLSLTGGDASLQDDRATTIDQAGAGDDRNVVAAHLPPQTSSEPAGGMDDDMDDVLEYIDDPNPRFHHAEVRNLPAPRQPEPQSKLPRAAEKLDSDSEPYEPVSDSAYSSSQPAPLRRRTRRGPRKPCYIAEELEDDMEADAKLACILNRRVSTSPSATSDVPYYTEHSATPEEEEPPRWPSTTSQILTFQDFRRQLQIHVRSSANIPHLFQDHINSLPQSFRDRPEIRAVFEAMMIENTWRDEPGAPRIKIINNIDSETTPPWEFHYSNHMWYGSNIPTPNAKKLKGCDCVGRCNPKSNTCACAKRQRILHNLHEDSKFRGFAYDKSGQLVFGDDQYPILECNDMCACDEDCMNRVIQRGRKCKVDLVKTADKGWGVFAAETGKIPKGTYIGIYAGELITDADGESRGKIYNHFGRTYLFNLDSYHLKYVNNEGDLMTKKEREKVDARYELEPEHDDFDNKYVVDAYHAGNFTRFLNHSCAPNCSLFSVYLNTPDLSTPLLALFSTRDIEPREELSFDYSGDQTADAADLPKKADAIHVKCNCGAPNCRGIMF